MTKLCRDCVYCEKVLPPGNGSSNLFCRKNSKLVADLVDGHLFWNRSEICAIARADPNHCGPEGRWWKPRPAVKLARIFMQVLKKSENGNKGKNPN
jgi:hypothetical protein